MTQQNIPCSLTEELAMERVAYHIRQIAKNPVSATPTGRVLDDALDLSGKMIRPRLLLLCGSFGAQCAQRFEQLCIAGAVVELTHLASLIHDDIVDEALFRRGKPALQSKYGKDAAVYAGDFLLARGQCRLAAEQLNDAMVRLAKAIEQMCLGEIGQAACRYHSAPTAEHYYENIRGKTAALFRCACGTGAALGGCPEEDIRLLEQFGEILGIIFQLRDDLLDFTSTKAKEGKQTHKDFLEGIYTLPVLFTLYHLDGADAMQALMQKNRQEGLSPAELQRMEQLVSDCGGIDRTWAEIHRHAADANALLDRLPPCGSTKKLKGMLNQLDTRISE